MVDSTPIPLQEDSTTLEMLFQFIHPCGELSQFRQPSVMNMIPKSLFKVAEAAEKYVVFGAMNVFVTRMQ